MNFYEMFNLLEGLSYDTALKMCGGSEELLDLFEDPTLTKKYLPMMVAFYNQQHGTSPVYEIVNGCKNYIVSRSSFISQINRVFRRYDNLAQKLKSLEIKRGVVYYGGEPVSWVKFNEIIDAKEGEEKFFSNRQQEVENYGGDSPIFDKNGIRVYEAHGPHKCIHYGKGYSFCISQPKNTMWQSYRDSQESTFYFVYDSNREKSDPLHIVVVDITNNGIQLTDARNHTGNIAEYGANVRGYMEYLQSKGVDVDIFKNIAMTDEEREDAELLSVWNNDVEWFKRLGYERQSKYIGRGNRLSDGQFDYLIEHKLDKLIEQYIGTGIALGVWSENESHQLNIVAKNPQWLRTHIRARFLVQPQMDDLTVQELLLSCRFKDLKLGREEIDNFTRRFNRYLSHSVKSNSFTYIEKKAVYKALLEKMEDLNRDVVRGWLYEFNNDFSTAFDAVMESELSANDIVKVYFDVCNFNRNETFIDRYTLEVFKKASDLDDIFIKPWIYDKKKNDKCMDIKSFCEDILSYVRNPDPVIIEIFKKKSEFYDKISEDFDSEDSQQHKLLYGEKHIQAESGSEVDSLLLKANDPAEVAKHINLNKMNLYTPRVLADKDQKREYVDGLVAGYIKMTDAIQRYIGSDFNSIPERED